LAFGILFKFRKAAGLAFLMRFQGAPGSQLAEKR
jgi:hypothetical protein